MSSSALSSENIVREVVSRLIDCLLDLKFLVRYMVSSDLLYGSDLSVDPVVKVRKFVKIYSNVLHVLALLRREELLRRFGKGGLSRILEEINRNLNSLVDLSELLNSDFGIDRYVPALVALVVNTCRLVREIALRVVGPVPEIDALLYEIRTLAKVLTRSMRFEFPEV